MMPRTARTPRRAAPEIISVIPNGRKRVRHAVTRAGTMVIVGQARADPEGAAPLRLRRARRLVTLIGSYRYRVARAAGYSRTGRHGMASDQAVERVESGSEQDPASAARSSAKGAVWRQAAASHIARKMYSSASLIFVGPGLRSTTSAVSSHVRRSILHLLDVSSAHAHDGWATIVNMARKGRS